jgi:hypothetical protein
VKTHYDPSVPIRDLYAGPFDNRAPLAEYEALHAIFPQALFVGYAPPISAWAIAEYQRIGWLRSYTGALWRVAGVFDRFTDYSVPSPLTRDPANTYDGTHYSEGTNAGIAADLLTDPAATALDLKALTGEQMQEAYRRRLR